MILGRRLLLEVAADGGLELVGEGRQGAGARTHLMSPAMAAAAAGNAVTIAKFAFAPASITVKAGQPVTFTNNDAITHTSTGPTWDSGDIQPGQSFTMTPTQPGTFTYHCSIHPFMTGTLIVE